MSKTCGEIVIGDADRERCGCSLPCPLHGGERMPKCHFLDGHAGVMCVAHSRPAYLCVIDERDRLKQGLQDLAREAQETEDAGDFILGVPGRVKKILGEE